MEIMQVAAADRGNSFTLALQEIVPKLKVA